MTTMIGEHSPWGTIDGEKIISDGIISVSTPSHGGIKLTQERNNSVPASMRSEGGWYEEDCEWSIPVMVFRNECAPDHVAVAEGIMKNWFPKHYTALTGIKLKAKESSKLREEQFRAKYINHYQGVAGYGSWATGVLEGMVGVMVVRGGRNNRGQYHSNDVKYLLVPADEYEKRGEFPFVVKKTYLEWKEHDNPYQKR